MLECNIPLSFIILYALDVQSLVMFFSKVFVCKESVAVYEISCRQINDSKSQLATSSEG